MSQLVLAIVLCAAFLDSIQHLLIKASRDPATMSIMVAVLGGLVGLAVLAVTGLPDPAAYPWLAASVLVGCLYWIALGWAYHTSTLGLVFPLSRGSAVVLTTIGAVALMQEDLSRPQMLTVCAVVAGLVIVAATNARGNLPKVPVLPSLVVGTLIAAFTLIDAVGVRAAGSAIAYCAAIYIGNALGVGGYALLCQRRQLLSFGAGQTAMALGLAILSITIYTMILFALTKAPVALVAALAETSIVFAAFLGLFWLREPARVGRLAGVAIVASGVVILKLAQ